MWWHFVESEEEVRRQAVWELMPKVLRLFRAHLGYLYLSLFLLVPVVAAQLAGPLILMYIIDGCFPGLELTIEQIGGVYAVVLRGFIQSVHAVAMAPDAPSQYLMLDRLLYGLDANVAVAVLKVLGAASLYVLLIAIATGAGYFQAVTLFRLGINIVTDLKARMFQHVLHLGLEFHEKNPPGKLLSRVESDTETLKHMFGDVAVNLTRSTLFFIGILVVLFRLDFAIAVWILLLVPFLFAATFTFLLYMRKWWREWRVQWAIVIGYVAEYVQGIEVIQLFNYRSRARERMREVNLGKFRVEAPAIFFEYGFWGVFLFGEIIAHIIVLLVGVGRVLEGTLTVGILVAIFEYNRQMFWPIMQLSEQLNFIQRGLISVERIFGILETERSVVDGPSPAEELKFEHEIAFENVWFAYEEENWILKEISFRIPKGDKIALVGTSGGGKSTVVNLLLRFYDPQKGRITVDGRDIRDFPVKAWRELIGLVLQDIYLFPGSVEDNLRVFDKMVERKRLEEVAGIARADTVIAKLPGAYEGELAERGANLSFGERQLMSFARALVYNPPLLVLDEATSSVDPHTERLVQEGLDRLLAGRTAVIVAHRLSTILNADKIILIHDGRVAESGSHSELLDLDGLYAKLFRLQFQEVGPSRPIRGEAS